MESDCRSWSSEPDLWSISQLETWLQAADEGFTSSLGWRLDNFRAPASNRSRPDLVRMVKAGLESLYRSFKPTYPIDFDILQHVDQLPPWSGKTLEEISGPATKPWGIRTSGLLERCFNSSYGMNELMAFIGKEVPHGLHPIDDFRHNTKIIAKAFDERKGKCILMQVTQHGMKLLAWHLYPYHSCIPSHSKFNRSKLIALNYWYTMVIGDALMVVMVFTCRILNRKKVAFCQSET